MPEVVTLVCDRPKCENSAARWRLDNGRGDREVLLCDKHAAPLRAAYELGHPAPPRSRARVSPRGIDERRLRASIKHTSS